MMLISNRLTGICTILGPGCSVDIYDDYPILYFVTLRLHSLMLKF
jgi:hypothetical protein